MAEGNIDLAVLEQAARLVLFPPGTYRIDGGYLEWNGSIGAVYSADGRLLRFVGELPEDAVEVGGDGEI